MPHLDGTHTFCQALRINGNNFVWFNSLHALGFHSNTGPNPLKITKLPSQHSMLCHHWHARETPFKWRFAGGSMVARYSGVFDLPSPIHQKKKKKKKKKKKTLSKLDLLCQNFLDLRMGLVFIYLALYFGHFRKCKHKCLKFLKIYEIFDVRV